MTLKQRLYLLKLAIVCATNEQSRNPYAFNTCLILDKVFDTPLKNKYYEALPHNLMKFSKTTNKYNTFDLSKCSPEIERFKMLIGFAFSK